MSLNGLKKVPVFTSPRVHNVTELARSIDVTTNTPHHSNAKPAALEVKVESGTTPPVDIQIHAVVETLIPTLEQSVPSPSRRRPATPSSAIALDILPSADELRRVIDAALVSLQPSSHDCRILSMLSMVLDSSPNEIRALMIREFVLPDSEPGE